MNSRLFAIIAAAGLFGGATARATIFDVSLTGVAADFTEEQFYFNGSDFDQFDLPLTVADSTLPIMVSEGDEVDSTVTLDTAYTIPMGPSQTFVLQYLQGAGFPSGNTGVTGVLTFFDGATPVAVFDYDSSSSGQLAAFGLENAPADPAFTFTSFTDDMTINTLSAPATLDSSAFEYDLLTKVPEPATWGLMIVGFGLAGAALRRRQPMAATRA